MGLPMDENSSKKPGSKHVLDYVDPTIERSPFTRIVTLLRRAARLGKVARLLPETSGFIAAALEDNAAGARDFAFEPERWTVEVCEPGEPRKVIAQMSDLTAAIGAWNALMAQNPSGRYITAQKARVVRTWRESDPDEIKKSATDVAMRALARDEAWRAHWNPEYELDEDIVCNHYTQRAALRMIMEMTRAQRDEAGNVRADIFPNYEAPIVRANADGSRTLAKARWGMPSSQKSIFDAATKRAGKLRDKGEDVDFDALLKAEPDIGTTNVRNTKSKHWTRWLDVAHRCLVPFTEFAEFGTHDGKKGEVWFGFADERPVAYFAGIWLPQWTGVRTKKEGEVTIDLFAFLTTEPNAVVAQIHPKAMPVILTTESEMDAWLTGSTDQALKLQRPLDDAVLKFVPKPRQ